MGNFRRMMTKIMRMLLAFFIVAVGTVLLYGLCWLLCLVLDANTLDMFLALILGGFFGYLIGMTYNNLDATDENN